MSLRLSPGTEPAGAFAPTGPPLEARSGHTATALPDCRVLIVGGAGDGDDPLASIEVHDADA